jgi:hypothetical protein
MCSLMLFIDFDHHMYFRRTEKPRDRRLIVGRAEMCLLHNAWDSSGATNGGCFLRDKAAGA